MTEGMKILDHLVALNGIVAELESIGVKIDEDKALKLIQSLPFSYAHIKPILMHGVPTISFEEVANKLISKEKRLRSEDKTFEDLALVINWKENSKKKVICQKCKQFDHVKRDCCADRASLAKGSKDCDVGNSSLNFVGDEDVF